MRNSNSILVAIVLLLGCLTAAAQMGANVAAGSWEPRNIATKAGLVASYDPGNTATETFNPAGYAAGSGVSWLSNRVSGVQSDLQQGTAANQPKISRTDNAGNLMKQSAAFDVSWSRYKINAFGSGSIANTVLTTDPLGGNTADFIQESTGTDVPSIYQDASSNPAMAYTFSCFCKTNGDNWVRLWMWDGLNAANQINAWFDLVNGVYGTINHTGTGSGESASITSFPNNWYLCEVSGVPTTTVGVATRAAISPTTGDGVTTRVLDNTSGTFIWGASLVPSTWTPITGTSAALGYVATTTVPIFPGLGNRAVLYMDGTAYRMQTAAFTLKQPTELYKLANPWTWTLNDVGCDGYTNQTLRITQSATTPKIRMDAGTTAAEFTPPPLGSWRVISAVFDGASSRMSTNSGAFTVSDAGTGNAGGFTLGSAATAGTTYWNGLVSRILICNKTNETAEANYLRWGLLKQGSLY